MSKSLRLKKNHNHNPYDLNNLEWTCDYCGLPVRQDRWDNNPRKKYCRCGETSKLRQEVAALRREVRNLSHTQK